MQTLYLIIFIGNTLLSNQACFTCKEFEVLNKNNIESVQSTMLVENISVNIYLFALSTFSRNVCQIELTDFAISKAEQIRKR